MKQPTYSKYLGPLFALASGMLAGNALAHDIGSLAGTPVCIESNYMMADAMNAPFSNIPGAGRVIEMNIFTGERGITVDNPLIPANDNPGDPICDVPGVTCTLPVPGPFGDYSAPWKPTGIVSGGENGHAYLTSAAQHLLIEHHRDGTPIRTGPLMPTSPSPNGGNFGFVPRLLGNGFMPNGNIAQAVCDANFFNAANSDVIMSGETDVTADGNSSSQFFPPVYSTGERGANGRVIVLDQVTLKTIDEYSMPTKGPYANDPRWNCPAGVIFTSEGLFVSMFHGNAVFVIDWKKGVQKSSAGVGFNGGNKKHGHDKDDDDIDKDDDKFKLGKKKNQARIIRVIDLFDITGAGAPDAPDYDSGHRRDNLRAIRMSEDGTLYGTLRGRSRECLRGEAPGTGNSTPCTPAVFRQHVFVVAPGANHKTGTLALDPGVNILAGVTVNRISGPGCAFVQQEVIDAGGMLTGDECDVETLYAATSAGNAGCDADNDGNLGPGHPRNQCFVPGGTVYEYRIDAAHLDGGNGKPCTGDPADHFGPGGGNEGCALPIAEFTLISDGVTSGLPAGSVEKVDPRMLMTIHEAFNQ
jgi:hypothetical protein